MDIRRIIKKHGETFEIRRGSESLEAKGLKNQEKGGRPYLSFEPDADVCVGDSLRGTVTCSEFQVTEIEREQVRGKLFQLKAYLDTPRTAEASMGIHIGSMINSTIQQGSPHATQVLTIDQQYRESAAEVIKAVGSALYELGLTDDDRDELATEIEAIKAQLKLKQPNVGIIAACLHGIKRGLEKAIEASAAAGTTVVAQGMLERVVLLLS